MSSVLSCRTCGEKIYNLNVKNLFDRESEELLKKIDILTGIRLYDDEDMPKHICACCYLDLGHSIAFRDRCITTQKLLRDRIHGDTSAPDPLSTTKEGMVYTPIISKTPSQRKEQCHKSQQNYIKAHLPDKQGSTTTRCVKKRAFTQETGGDANLSKAQIVPKINPIAMHEYPPSETEGKNGSKSERDENASFNVKHHGIRKSYVCDQCGKCFADASNLKVHILRHTGVKNFECLECGTKYFTRHLLNLHIRVRHQGEMPYACKYCEQRFFTSTTRCRHERVKHTRKLTYACRLCGKKYFTKSCLNKHEFLHTGERPYRCNICNVGFPRNTNLKIHYRSNQHQKKANAPLDKPYYTIIDASFDGESDTDSIIKELYS